jgi:hypothetical protein
MSARHDALTRWEELEYQGTFERLGNQATVEILKDNPKGKIEFLLAWLAHRNELRSGKVLERICCGKLILERPEAGWA